MFAKPGDNAKGVLITSKLYALESESHNSAPTPQGTVETRRVRGGADPETPRLSAHLNKKSARDIASQDWESETEGNEEEVMRQLPIHDNPNKNLAQDDYQLPMDDQ